MIIKLIKGNKAVTASSDNFYILIKHKAGLWAFFQFVKTNDSNMFHFFIGKMPFDQYK